MNTRNLPISRLLFAGTSLDRRAEERNRTDWLAIALDDPDTRFLVVQGTAALVMDNVAPDGLQLAFLRNDDPLAGDLANADTATLLGWFRNQRCVLLLVDQSFVTPPHTRFEELRALVTAFAPEEAGVFGYARALAYWRGSHRHCGRCSGALRAARAGHALICTACSHESFPRLDPAVIVLVRDGEFALLGRQSFWPPQRYSTIAGFVETGETIEAAVHREVREETGIVLRDVRYCASQPWPFPSSLMLGFFATAEAQQQPVAHDGELEDARWFTREEVLGNHVLLPPAESISRHLIDHWLERR